MSPSDCASTGAQGLFEFYENVRVEALVGVGPCAFATGRFPKDPRR